MNVDYASPLINAIKSLERARESAERKDLETAIAHAEAAKLEVEFVIEAFEAMKVRALAGQR